MLVGPAQSSGQVETTPVASPPEAQQTRRPALAKRLVASFGFDDSPGDSIGLPRGWFRAQDDPGVPRDRPGFPIWNAGRVDTTVAYEGTGSVVLPASGGSASLRLDPGVIPIFPGAEYATRAMARTVGARTARARVVASVLDAEGEPIPGAVSTSALVSTSGAWVPVEATLSGDWPDAAFLQIDLELLQAREFADPSLGPRHVWVDDFDAFAWFDSISVTQVPSTRLTTRSGVGITRAPQQPIVEVEARDFTGEPIDARLSVIDHTGRVVATHDAGRAGGRFVHEWRPSTDRHGWFRASLHFAAEGELLASSHVDFISLPAPRAPVSSDDASRFGLVAPPDALTAPGDLREVREVSGLARIVLPFGREEPISAADLEGWLGPLLRLDTSLVLGADASDALLERTGDPKPWLAEALRRFAPTVDGWMLDSSRWRPDHAIGLRESIDLLAGRGRVVQPWSVERPWPESTPETLLLTIPPATSAEAIPTIMDELATWLGSSEEASARLPADVDLVIEPLPAGRFGAPQTIAHLVEQTTRALAALDARGMVDRSRVLMPRGWSRSADGRVQPTPELAAWITLAERFEGRRVVGAIRFDDHVEGYVLAPIEQTDEPNGALVIWSNRVGGRASLSAPLANEAVRMLDVLGNATALRLEEPPGARGIEPPVHTVPIRDEPVFVEPIDEGVLLFRSMARLEPQQLDSSSPIHDMTLVLGNPWSVAISGEARLSPPANAASTDSWKIRPAVLPFDIAPGGEARIPLTLEFSAYEESGSKRLGATVDLRTTRDVHGVQLSLPFEIGLPGLRLETSYRPYPEGAGPDAIIEARITNTGETERALELRAFPPGRARLRAPALILGAGRTTFHRFVVQNALPDLQGERVIVTLRDVDTAGALNSVVEIR